MYEFVRPKHIMDALIWLKQHNPLYKDIEICDDWEKQWREGDGDLWEAITKLCDDDMETEEVTEDAVTDLPPPIPIGHDYQGIVCLARRNGFGVHNVPGDGNCFFHAVSASLSSAGVQPVGGLELRERLIHHLQTTNDKNEYMGFLQAPANFQALLPASPTKQQSQLYESYIRALINGEWADNLAVQALADMLNINICVINTISPDWIHHIQPRHGSSDNTVFVGLIGEQHYVALERKEHENEAGNSERNRRQQIQDEKDRVAFEETSKLRGVPYDTLLQEEQLQEGDTVHSVALGESQKPRPFLTDDLFQELANPTKYSYDRGGFTTKREKNITVLKYFNQRLLHKDGRFAKDIDYLLAAQYAVEAKQVRDDLQISLRQTRGQTFQNRRLTAGLMRCSDTVQAMIRTDTAFKFLKNVRGSPAYWNTVLLDLLAMVRQLGMPTWFLTLSAADMQWPEVIQSIAFQYGKSLSPEDVKNLT